MLPGSSEATEETNPCVPCSHWHCRDLCGLCRGPQTQTCAACDGTGYRTELACDCRRHTEACDDMADSIECPECDGTGNQVHPNQGRHP